ncbi:Ig-like domain-containing protein, partial [Staphylococcus warneri]|uniref:Ig-like domain-containing protein n=2 Tax=Staphylococcus TaxID=1279 RepID=UPI003CFB55F0
TQDNATQDSTNSEEGNNTSTTDEKGTEESISDVSVTNENQSSTQDNTTQDSNNSEEGNGENLITTNENTAEIESEKGSSIPLSDNETSLTNQVVATNTTRNNIRSFRMLVATQNTNVKTYNKPLDPKYAYLLNDLGYNATTIKENSGLRYAGISQLQNGDKNVIKLNLTKWLSLNQGDFTNGGNINLSFVQSDFYKQIQSITLSGVQMTTNNNGQNWTAPINGSTVSSGIIGSVTNHDVLITLKDSKTLESLGYSNSKPVYLTHTWTMNDGSIAAESIQVSTITPTIIDKAPQMTQSSGFTSGKVVNKIKYNNADRTIKSIHTFKPDENFLQSDYNWLLYIKEQVNKDLIPYIDPSSVKIFASDVEGNAISSDRYVNGTIDSNGLFDSSTISSISIKQTNTGSQLSTARGNLDRNIFYGTLGQSRSYTIQYKLKDGYNLENLASQLSDRETFQSWMETDYLNTIDNGTVNKRLLGSYATSYIDMIDRVAPATPKASNITTQDTTVNGTSEPNTNITLNFSDGRELTGTTDSTGNFSVSIPKDFVLTGKETISIIATDKGLNKSSATVITVTD